MYNLDISHFNSKDERVKGLKECSKAKQKKLEDILVKDSAYTYTNDLKKRLYKEGIKERICELCGQGEFWNERKMSLVLDHINGINNDNRLENLRIICPNCDATLDTYCGKNLKNKKVLDGILTHVLTDSQSVSEDPTDS